MNILSDKVQERITNDQAWKVVNAFHNFHGNIHHKIESYNQFIEELIPKFLQENRIITLGKKYIYKLELCNYNFEKPTHKEITEEIRGIFPLECVNRDITYQSQLLADIIITNPEGEDTLYEHVPIGMIPVMVHSKLCNLYGKTDQELIQACEDPLDEGGYFIINGVTKNLICQERTAFNNLYIFTKRKKHPKFYVYVEVRSASPSIYGHSTTAQVGCIANGIISTVIPYIEGVGIPIGIIFKALGCVKEMDMIKYITNDMQDIEFLTILEKNLEPTVSYTKTSSALRYIGQKGKKFSEEGKKEKVIVKYASNLISNEFLPHLGQSQECNTLKCIYYGRMVNMLINTVLGRRIPSDRDNFDKKRTARDGELLYSNFVSGFRKMITAADKSVCNGAKSKGRDVNIIAHLKNTEVGKSLLKAIKDNKWVTQNMLASQQYEKFNYAGGLSNLRKCVTTVNKNGDKINAPRKLHGSQWMACCPSETPEGKRVGIVKNLAMLAIITSGCSSKPVSELLYYSPLFIKVSTLIDTQDFSNIYNHTCVFVNGCIEGFTSLPQELVNYLRYKRKKLSFSYEVSINYDHVYKEIHIFTDSGRLCHPMFTIKDGEIVATPSLIDSLDVWTDYLKSGIVDIIDKLEEDNGLICPSLEEFYNLPLNERREYTHCEFHPSLMFGVGATIIPFANRDHAPKITYQSAMTKQAFGVPGLNCQYQTKGKVNQLMYPQKPLITTRGAKLVKYDILSAGQNAKIIVCGYRGFNQEDAIILNKDSVDRGFGISQHFISFEYKLKDSTKEKIATPQDCTKFEGNPRFLYEGIIKHSCKVKEGDILVGVVNKSDNKPGNSLIYNCNIPGTVHTVHKGVDAKGLEYVRVVICQTRSPVVGDKFSGVHGQKGVAGYIAQGIDLPFDKYGVAPDVLLNPCALPSRMTLGMVLEIFASKRVLTSPILHKINITDTLHLEYDDTVDATPFDRSADLVNILNEEMVKLGESSSFGEETYTCGMTGKKFSCLVFSGFCFYQRLKHMVLDKLHVRSYGKKANLTRQPKEGRRFKGGLKVGNMERDNLTSQGVQYVIRDRMLEQSDVFKMWICDVCGWSAIVHEENKIKECKICQTSSISLVKLPYGAKLLRDELAGMGIICRYIPDKGLESIKK